MAALIAEMPERPLYEYLQEASDRNCVRVGSALPLGTTTQENGGNFALFSRNATGVRLELFDHPLDQEAARKIDLDPLGGWDSAWSALRPLIKPNQSGREGYVPNVVYTCGALLHNGELIVPYGLADHATGFATMRLSDVLAAME